MENKLQEVLFPVLIEYLEKIKDEIIADGFIPTIDEAITRLQEKI